MSLTCEGNAIKRNNRNLMLGLGLLPAAAVIVVDAQGKPVYNQAGEQDEKGLSRIFDEALN